MLPLTPADLVSVWELGQGRPNWHKALLILGPSFPNAKPSELAALTIGERNARLFELRRLIVGPVMNAFVRCPKCREPLEFEQQIDELLEGYQPPAGREQLCDAGSFHLRFRVPDSNDLAHGWRMRRRDQARTALIRSAVTEAAGDEGALDPAQLPEEAVSQIAEKIAECDPLENVLIALACASCGNVWKASLDIVTFFWTEIEARAKRLLSDVQAIARAFGWAEGEILSMSDARRQYYLEAIE